MHPYVKLQVCIFIRFDDMFEGVPDFIRVTRPRPRPFSEFLFVHFVEIVHMHAYMPNLKSVALLVLEICLRVCQIL